jgi:hypothetical protein
MSSILSFFLCESPSVVHVIPVSDLVFSVSAPSPAVARFVVNAGPRHCARFQLGFHASMTPSRVRWMLLSLSPRGALSQACDLGPVVAVRFLPSHVPLSVRSGLGDLDCCRALARSPGNN